MGVRRPGSIPTLIPGVIPGLIVAWAVFVGLAAPAVGQSDRPFTIGNYPVEATAQDAVAAKEKAISEGQQAAFRSLLKRLTPVNSYKSLTELRQLNAANLIQGIAVRSERNSSTSYRASLDFAFDAQRVRDLLRQRSIPFVDEPARETAVVLIVQPVGAQAAASSTFTGKTWRDAWTGLDLENGLTPVKLHDRPANLSPEILKQSLTNPEAPLRTIAILNKSGQALIALAEPDGAARRLHVTMTGTDGVGPFVLKRTWRMDPSDAAYTGELAAVVALGIVEGRWKAVQARPVGPRPQAGGVPQPVQLSVEFRSNQEWLGLRRQITEMPGVSDFSIGGVSGRAADIALRYPGGGEALAHALTSVGVEMRPLGGAWIARAVN